MIASLLAGDKVKQTRAKQEIFIYQDMFIERLGPVLDAAWSIKKKEKKYTNNSMRITHRNGLLGKLLANEPADVRALVKKKAQESAELAKKEVEASDLDLLTPEEAALSADERARIIIGKKRQQ